MAIAERAGGEEILQPPPFEFSTYTPLKFITNEDLATEGLRTLSGRLMSPQQIYETTGVTRRFVAGDDETALAMARAAVGPVVREVGAGNIQTVLVSSSFPTGQNLATKLVYEFGLHADTVLEVGAACAGVPRALAWLWQHHGRRNLPAENILLVATEKYSPYVEGLDRAIFSDGAAAWYVQNLEILHALNWRQPSDLIRMPIDRSLIRHPYLEEPVPPCRNGLFEMEGPKVYREIIGAIPSLINRAIGEADLQPEDIALVIAHQTSGRLNDKLAKLMPELPMYWHMEDGNFSSASILFALGRACQEGGVKPGDTIVLAGFGAGLVASIVICQLR